jgi:hypothetical protein
VASTRLRPLATHVPIAAAAVAVVAAATFSQVLPDRVTPEVYEPMRRWAEERGLRERNDSIVASDIGAIGWYGGLILDTEGLVWPQGRDFEHQIDVVRAHRPDYVVVVVRRDKIVRFMADPLFTEYRPVQRFNTTGDRTLEPVAALLPHWWEQDYLVYERID